MLMRSFCANGNFVMNKKNKHYESIIELSICHLYRGNHHFFGYMIMIDYVLGAEAEHLNAWVIVNRLFGNETTVGDSLAIRQFGLMGATMVMLAINSFFGVILIQLVRLFIRFIHS